jgi:hypothetical protein
LAGHVGELEVGAGIDAAAAGFRRGLVEACEAAGNAGQVRRAAVNATLEPNALSRMVAAAELNADWVSTYSGASGVVMSGVKFGSF